jgi:putative transposase
MPRFGRVVAPGCPHHITQRGNGRRDVFFTAEDKRVYLDLLKTWSEFYTLRVLGYCLMTNHVHLVAIPERTPSLARTLREVHGRYAQYRNAIEHNYGHVWQNRFYSCPFEPVRLPSVLRYVELNPVRAGMALAAEDYRWSSAAAHLGCPDSAGLLDGAALASWRLEWTPEEWAAVLRQGADASEAIREATFGGRPCGSAEFTSSLERELGRQLAKGKPGRPRKSEKGPSVPDLIYHGGARPTAGDDLY